MVGGGMCGGGACVAGGHVWQGACMAGGAYMAEGACILGGGRGCVWQGGMHGRRYGHCSGRYASYWNVFLLNWCFPLTNTECH